MKTRGEKKRKEERKIWILFDRYSIKWNSLFTPHDSHRHFYVSSSSSDNSRGSEETMVNFNVNTRVSITNYIYICTDDFEYESIGGGTRIILGCTIEEIRRTKNNNFDDKFSFLPREITNWRGGGRLIITANQQTTTTRKYCP